jgi:hypothetical protein
LERNYFILNNPNIYLHYKISSTFTNLFWNLTMESYESNALSGLSVNHLLRCDVWSSRWALAFRRNLQPSTSTLKIETRYFSDELVPIYQTRRLHIPLGRLVNSTFCPNISYIDMDKSLTVRKFLNLYLCLV